MGNIFGKKSTIDKLQEIDNELDINTADQCNIEGRHKRAIRKLVSTSLGAYVSVACVLLIHYRICRSNRLFYLKYLLSPPLIFACLYASTNCYYGKRIAWKNKRASKLKIKKQEIYKKRYNWCDILFAIT